MLLPGPIRKLVAVFRGEVLPLLILFSIILGFWLGVTPGWSGLHVALLVVALVVNVNIGLVVFSAALGKAFAIAAAPLLFHTGVWVQDEMVWLPNLLASIPIIGITDYSQYAVAGGLIIGPIGGFLLGSIVAYAAQLFRRGWLRMEEGSPAFKAWRNKWWVRLLDRILIGRSTRDVGAVLTRRPKFIRMPGVVLALVVILVSAVGLRWFEDDLAAGYARTGLTHVNGAEVNLASLDLEILRGRLAAGGIEATDPAKPMRNRLNIGEVEADVSLTSALLGRLVIQKLMLKDVTFDSPRSSAGYVLEGSAEETEQEQSITIDFPDGVALQEYLARYEELKERLQHLREWMPESSEEQPVPPEPRIPEGYLDYLTARAPTSPVPRILVQEITIDGVETQDRIFGRSRLTIQNMSDAPGAAGLPVSVRVESQEREVTFEMTSHYESEDGGVSLKLSFQDLDLTLLQSQLEDSNPVVFTGGTVTGSIEGRADRSTIDLAVKARTQGMRTRVTAGIAGLDESVTSQAMDVLDNLETTLRIAGPITQPELIIDDEAIRQELSQALAEAGKAELARRIDALAGEHASELGVDGRGVTDDPVGTAGKAAEGLLRGSKTDADKRPEEESKKDSSPLENLLR